MDKGIVFDLNEAARLCPDPAKRKALRDLAIELDAALSRLTSAPTQDHMVEVNGVMVRAIITLEAVLSGGGGHGGGSVEPTRLAA